MRQSPHAGEYAIYKTGALPAFRELALKNCSAPCAEPVRRSVQNRCRHTGTPPALVPADADTSPSSGLSRNTRHSDRLRTAPRRRTDLRTLGTTARHTAWPERALPPALEPLRRHDTARPAAWPLGHAARDPGTATYWRLPAGNRNPIAGARRRSCCCVETMCTGRGFCERPRAAQSGPLPSADCDASQCSC
jgi:hypothetical protein